ncbi:MAG: tRNA (guanosine(46)-N7)-methyltransferase TrmB [Acaryochloridaceae cyanobacterium CSU_3_4]|nr:tRNA (guanosine(46)-N7)-methyltransferase TrmB [Acaryochloridaceae cyanobacterium CSU_3_4]
MPKIRIRQHVNPLLQKFQNAIAIPQWNQVYTNPNLPLHLDIGCARGQFLLEMAQLQPHHNFLGIEIRQVLVEAANQERDPLHLGNLHYLFANINAALSSLVSPSTVQGVMIQFPDPWFKRRHQKRRVVQPQLVQDLAICVRSGGFVFIQSDILAVAVEIRDRIAEHPAFEQMEPTDGWLTQNPLPVATERERLTLEQGLPVYRCWFHKRG